MRLFLEVSFEPFKPHHRWCSMSIASASLQISYGRSESAQIYGLPPETLADLNSLGEVVEYPDGTNLMRQGDLPSQVKILSRGRAKVTTSSREGKTLFLNIAGAGGILGLVSAIRRIKYEATALAYGPCVVNEIDDQDFFDFLSHHRSANWQVMQMLAEENCDLLVNARRVALSGSVAGSVARLLLDWSATLGEGVESKRYNLGLTHQEIAEMVGTTRESVTRTLAHFRSDGWIRVHGASVEILQEDKMKRISI
jgi:CRP/FNR family cyclic AMP-dependent transcriptional regulator